MSIESTRDYTSGQTVARWLFGLAAGFNALVGLGLLFGRKVMAGAMPMDPIAGTNQVLLYLTAGFILLFAYAYVLVARDPVRYRPFVPLAVTGKLMAVVSAVGPWLAEQIPASLPALASGDLIFAALFVWFLRRYPAA